MSAMTASVPRNEQLLCHRSGGSRRRHVETALGNRPCFDRFCEWRAYQRKWKNRNRFQGQIMRITASSLSEPENSRRGRLKKCRPQLLPYEPNSERSVCDRFLGRSRSGNSLHQRDRQTL